MKKIRCFKLLLPLLALFICCQMPQNVKAAETATGLCAQEIAQLNDAIPYFTEYPSLNNGESTIAWSCSWVPYSKNAANFGYEIQIADNLSFTNATSYKTAETSLTINIGFLGSNGGKLYCRGRAWGISDTNETGYSNWSDTKEFIFIKINKKNFPGLYTLLKNGGETYRYKANGKRTIEKITYDTNGDGWLDPSEIIYVNTLETVTHEKKKNGRIYTTPTCKVSSLSGIEYLPEVTSLRLAQYSGKTIDVSKQNVAYIEIKGITASQIKVNAPDAITVDIEGDSDTKLKKIDLSKCKNARNIFAYGNRSTTQLKLPTNKTKLIELSLSKITLNMVNLNVYKNLRELYFYDCSLSKLKINKCKNLQYLYFYQCNKLKSINLKPNTRLVGVDFYSCKKIQKKQVKALKKTKVTYNKGKWWYQTTAWQNLH